MRLRDLGARFVQHKIELVDPTVWIDGTLHTDGRKVTMPWVDSLEDAHGIVFKCPKCFGTNNPHSVVCWFVGKVSDDVRPGPGRWTPQGTGLEDLTFVPGVPARAISVLLTGEGCGWHGFVRNGDAA